MNEENGMEEFRQLQLLAAAGKYQDALKQHLWFHEASKKISGMGGVRLSYALEIWIELAEKYSPAMDALLSLRDSNKNVLLSGDGSFENFHDFSSINEMLGKDDDTYALFLVIHNSFPNQAKRYYHVVEHLIVKNKAYDICSVYIDDPIKKYTNIRHLHQMHLNSIRKNPEMDNEDFKSYAEESYVREVCQLIGIMLETSKEDIAEQIREMALKYFDHDEIRLFKSF